MSSHCWNGAIGFADDYLKLRLRRSLGLPGRWKMTLLVAVTVGAAVLYSRSDTFSTSIYVPLAGWNLDLTGARYDTQTRWPTGFDPRRHGAILTK